VLVARCELAFDLSHRFGLARIDVHGFDSLNPAALLHHIDDAHIAHFGHADVGDAGERYPDAVDVREGSDDVG
jgi:hypothetical protein